jgi:hypothetical protein
MRFVNLSHDRDSAALRSAYDSAVEEAHALGIETTDDLEAAMAIGIMAAIEEGEYDVEQLKRWALHEVDRKKFSAPSTRPRQVKASPTS